MISHKHIVVASAMEAGSLFANAINTVKTAEGFCQLGYHVTIMCWHPNTGKISNSTLNELYGLKSPIKWIQMAPTILGKKLNAHWHFALQAIYPLLRLKPDLIYARNYMLPYLTSKIGIPTIAECHAHEGNKDPNFLKFIQGTRSNRFLRLNTISGILANYYISIGAPEDKLSVVSDAVDLSLFSRPLSVPKTPYPVDTTNIVYAGHLYDYKGIPTVLKTASQMPHCLFHFVGGFPEDIQKQKQRAQNLDLKNVVFHGSFPHSKVPNYLWHADILLLPPSLDHLSARWTSPVKLGEYLAAERPVVASHIPALDHWLTEESCYFFTPDDPHSLQKTIECALSNPIKTQSRIESAKKLALKWSYSNRARNILKGLDF